MNNFVCSALHQAPVRHPQIRSNCFFRNMGSRARWPVRDRRKQITPGQISRRKSEAGGVVPGVGGITKNIRTGLPETSVEPPDHPAERMCGPGRRHLSRAPPFALRPPPCALRASGGRLAGTAARGDRRKPRRHVTGLDPDQRYPKPAAERTPDLLATGRSGTALDLDPRIALSYA